MYYMLRLAARAGRPVAAPLSRSFSVACNVSRQTVVPTTRSATAAAIQQSRAFSSNCSSVTRSVLMGPRSGAAAPSSAAKRFSLRRPVRFLCTEPGPGATGASYLTAGRQVLAWMKQNTTVVAVIAGAAMVMYGFYRFSIRVMKFFFNVSDKTIFTGGFVLGMVAMAAIIGTAAYTNRFLSLNIEQVYQAAQRELRLHESVTEAMGGAWHPTSFKGYAIESLQNAVQGSERRARSSFLEAPARRVQMIFTIKGLGRNGMVSLEAYKRNGAHHFEMLSLDVQETDEHIFLMGEDDHKLFPEVTAMLKAAKK